MLREIQLQEIGPYVLEKTCVYETINLWSICVILCLNYRGLINLVEVDIEYV
jgi:hypothetical protein